MLKEWVCFGCQIFKPWTELRRKHSVLAHLVWTSQPDWLHLAVYINSQPELVTTLNGFNWKWIRNPASFSLIRLFLPATDGRVLRRAVRAVLESELVVRQRPCRYRRCLYRGVCDNPTPVKKTQAGLPEQSTGLFTVMSGTEWDYTAGMSDMRRIYI